MSTEAPSRVGMLPGFENPPFENPIRLEDPKAKPTGAADGHPSLLPAGFLARS